MFLNDVYEIKNLCANPNLVKALERTIIAVNADEKSATTIRIYFNSLLNELLDVVESFIISIDSISINEHEYCINQYQEQVAYFWIKLQSDWIRYNNMANFNLAYKGEDDIISQAKAAISSFFIQPIGERLEPENISKNVEFINLMLKRSKLSDDNFLSNPPFSSEI
jgi:hypothetical protein